MAVIETWLHQDLQEPVKVNHLDGNLFSNNGNGNRIGVVLTNNGEALASISGTVSGYVVTADGSTVPCTGSKSGNRASILIPAAAYQPGSIFITVFVTDGTTVTTIGAVSTTVMRSRTNAQVDPGSAVADWTQTINAAMQSVETAAANLGGIVAVPYASITFPVPLGKYTYYNNNLYRCITPIASSESFTAAHWTQVRLGDDVSDLKSALTHDTGLLYSINDSGIVVGTKSTDGTTFYVKLPVTLVDGNYYCVEFTLPSDMVITASLHTSESAGSLVETLANKQAMNAGTHCLMFQKTSSKKYIKMENNGAVLPVLTQTYTNIRFDKIESDMNFIARNAYDGFIDYGEAMSNMVLLGTCVLTNSYNAALPASVGYGKTFYVEFELSSDVDKVKLTINQTDSYSTAKKTIFNNQPLKAGKYGFIFKRESNMNYIRMELNGSAPASLTFNIYNTEKNFVELKINTYGKAITTLNYSTSLSDLNSAADNTLYVGQVNQSNHPANMPFTLTGYATFELLSIKQDIYIFQTFYHSGVVYSRIYNGSVWTNWSSFYDKIQHRYEVDKTYTDYQYDNDHVQRFSSLVLAIEEATKYPNSIVKVNAGTYDILDEYQTLHPDDWKTRNDGRGLNLNSGIHLLFSSKALVTCNYDGDEESVLTNFSAFNIRYASGSHGVSATIENLHIEGSRIRYLVHDDMYDSSIPYHTTYKNCDMKIDNSENLYRSFTPHCIGGGFGQNGHIVLENCIFEGIGGDGTTYPAIEDNSIVAWHNGPNASQKSALFMSGCYFKNNGTFRTSSHGTATEKTTELISGNSFGNPIIIKPPESGKPVNVEVIAFNNEIRI